MGLEEQFRWLEASKRVTAGVVCTQIEDAGIVIVAELVGLYGWVGRRARLVKWSGAKSNRCNLVIYEVSN